MSEDESNTCIQKKAPDFSDASFVSLTEQLPVSETISDTSGNPNGVDIQCKYSN